MTETLTVEQRRAALEGIAAEVRACTRCPLHAAGRTNAVPGAGSYTAEVMFIGEGPGFNEDRQGLPFVGQSGKLLDELLSMIGMRRSQVFITNVVKCRPPENRDPLPDEITICTQAYLYRQIELIAPKVIVTLGRFSMGLFFPNAKITQIHGREKWENGRAYLPLYHPAAVLRNMETLKPQMEADFRKIPQLVAQWASRQSSTTAASASAEPPEQLTLF
ncbi:MAG: uracil-DNA glycosylase [Anaerolineae bacterium]|nr:uracil-DNA glycosylase [Anaerolineae bacterium]MDW8299066.1 uracil-DNA glycosylase [Anaerolineae bacterium]